MSTIQLIGLAIAVIVLIVLIVTLVVTRGKGEAETAEPPAAATRSLPTPPTEPASVFAGKPRDDLAGLGKPVPAPSPAWDALPPSAGAAMAAAAVAGGSLAAADEVPAEGVRVETGEVGPVESGPGAPFHAEPVGGVAGVAAAELRDAEPTEPEPVEAAPSPVEAAPSVTEAPLSPVEAAPSPVEAAPSVTEATVSPVEEAGSPTAGIALSEIIVTTNQQQIDLEDPEVRRLLKDLVEYEIELAQQYRDQGQNVDAVLQLTEAEKACNALGLTSKARLIRAMIKELKD